MRAAILDDAQIVENIIMADEAFCKVAHPGRYIMLSEDQWCDIGARWDGKQFTPAA